MRHWLLALNVSLVGMLAGALAAPLLAAVGLSAAAEVVYTAYRFTCHQWAFRSFFLFGAQPVYAQADLAARGLDPFSFVGDQTLGWKIGFCERDVAIYIGLLVIGLLYARRRTLKAPGFALYTLLSLPLALDGFSQLLGFRESTWELRVATGLLFGLASAWLVMPRLDAAFGPIRASAAYPAGTGPAACEPAPQMSRVSPSRGG